MDRREKELLAACRKFVATAERSLAGVVKLIEAWEAAEAAEAASLPVVRRFAAGDAHPDGRVCLACGEAIVRRVYESSGKLESVRVFLARVVCDSVCRGRLMSMRAKAKKPAEEPAVAAPVVPPVVPPVIPPVIPPVVPVVDPLRPVEPVLPPKPVEAPLPVRAVESSGSTERWRPPSSTYEPVRMVDKGPVTFCEKHPNDTIGVFGCTACNAGRKWREAQGVRRVGLSPNTAVSRSSS